MRPASGVPFAFVKCLWYNGTGHDDCLPDQREVRLDDSLENMKGVVGHVLPVLGKLHRPAS